MHVPDTDDILIYTTPCPFRNSSQTVLPLGKWSVGRPAARALRRTFSRIPLFSLLVKGAVREDRMAVLSPLGKKGASVDDLEAAAPAPRVSSRRMPQDPRQTGHPPLLISSAIAPNSFEGDAVRHQARTGDVRSAIGPF